MKTKLTSIIFALLAIIPLATISAQSAQKFTGLLIRTPAEYGGFTYEFFMDPGESRCDSFIAQHDFQDQSEVKVYYTMVSDLEIEPESLRPIFPRDTLTLDSRYSLANWVTVEKDKITLPYWGYEEQVDFCINVPEDANPGSHYAVLLLSNLTKQEYLQGGERLDIDDPFNGAAIGSRSGVNLLVTVSGGVNKNIEVESLEVKDIDLNNPPLGILEYLPANVIATLINGGNQFVKPAGNLSIHQGDLTKPNAIFPFNPNAIRILPETRYQLVTTWEDAPLYLYKQDDEQKTTSLGVNLSKLGNFRIGRYFATLQMTYHDIDGNPQRAADYTVEFWVVPWKIIIAVVIVGSLFVYIGRRRRKNSVKYITKSQRRLALNK